ncbi:MAG: hypothetical protein WD738_06410 [Pirellulales bacterium]
MLKALHSTSTRQPGADQAIEHRADEAVAPTTFEADGGLQPASGAEDVAPLRSVIINQDEASDAVRSAQLPFGDDQAQPEADQPASSEPMPNELPPMETTQPESLELETPAPPGDDTLQLDQNQRQPIDQQLPPPTDIQPAPLDTTMPPGPLPAESPTPNVGAMQAEREKAEQACTQGLADLQAKTIDTLEMSIAVTGAEGSDYPFECSLDEAGHEGRCWEQTTYLWKASALCHKPLYFEDEHLERYGHSWPPCCQPLVSGAHFFTRLPILPYCMGIEPPNECIYALGHYRPGSCAPYMCNPIPFSWRGALFQAGAVVGAAAVLP